MTTTDELPFDGARADVESALRAAFGIEGEEATDALVELEGGASPRRFFRVPLSTGTVLAMHVPPGDALIGAAQTSTTTSFVDVARLLARAGIPVPELVHESAHPNVLLVEDLGDDTLFSFLATDAGKRERESLYRDAVKTLARARTALSSLPAGSSVATRSFDRELLRWELEHFREWALEARGVALSAEENAVLDRAFERLVETIVRWPYGFCHRDYQSKNLMVRGSDPERRTLTWIDFQDAMLGPRAYDLVALLMDSYQDLDAEFVEARLREYVEEIGTPHELDRLRAEFRVMTAQRKLKDAGRFVYLDRVRKNPGFLRYVDGSVERAARALTTLAEEHPDYAALLDLLRAKFPALVR